jgi:hypothetical protein
MAIPSPSVDKFFIGGSLGLALKELINISVIGSL